MKVGNPLFWGHSDAISFYHYFRPSAFNSNTFKANAFYFTTQYKCRAILDAMRRAHIPWSESMQALVDQGLALKHPR